LVNRSELVKDIAPFYLMNSNKQKILLLSEAVDIIMQMAKYHSQLIHQKPQSFNTTTTWNYSNKQIFTEQIKSAWVKWKLGYFNENMPLTRLEFAKLLDATIHPFDLKQVDHQGKFIE
jgi:hypothetical protein